MPPSGTIGVVLSWRSGVAAVAAISAVGREPAAQPSAERLAAAAGGRRQTKNPLTVDAKVLATGKTVFKDKCQKCHGPGGPGDGPDADPDAGRHGPDQREARRAQHRRRRLLQDLERPPEAEDAGLQKEELTKEQVWSVVAYVQTLRKTTHPEVWLSLGRIRPGQPGLD